MPDNTKTPIRRTAGLLSILALVAFFFSLYFFRYVPEQKRDFHQRAFSQLKQTITAFNDRNEAYEKMVKSYLKAGRDTIGKDMSIFHLTWHDKKTFKRTPIDSMIVKSAVEPDLSGNWMLKYYINKLCFPGKDSTIKLADYARSLSTVLPSLTAACDDIFNNFLMIRVSDSGRGGEIVFNSGGLSMDYFANTDTLLKKSDGFSLLNINDVKIEGDQYKLFLYPFKCCGSRLILAGLISQSHYTQGYESIPANMITIGGVLLLLLLVALPLLKIYIIGSRETITNFDLRMIIGAYFLGTLTFFFLFSWIFIEKVQSACNKTRLTNLAGQIQVSLENEIHAACRQLRAYDNIYKESRQVREALAKPNDLMGVYNSDIFLYPLSYPQLDRVAWINDSGRWVGRWGFKKYENLPLINVSDRKYFNDMISNNLLVLTDSLVSDSFCINPLLSKLDGEYNITLAIKSDSGKSVRPYRPVMLALSSKMYSVFNPVLPPGTGFSIIDNTGLIQFDSKQNRSLLSNIFAEMPDNDVIRQCVDYRQERYFSSIMLRGHKAALLVKPLPDLHYTFLIYSNRDRDKEFEVHVLGLACFFIGCMISLLFLSGYINEWGRKRTSLLYISNSNFEWLRPVPGKARYYSYLVTGFSILTGTYVVVWAIVELAFRRYEFSLFAFSFFLPFYIAIFYFILRDQQKFPGNIWPRPLPALLVPVSTIILIMGYIYLGDIPGAIKICTGFAQILLTVVCWLLLRKSPFSPNIPSVQTIPAIDPATIRDFYVKAILMGLVSTVLIPAIGLFFFFFKEEMRTSLKQEKLTMAKSIDERRSYLHAKLRNYRFYATDTAFIRELQIHKGIYFPDGTSVDFSASRLDTRSAHPPKAYYDLHNFVLSQDNTPLTQGETPELAGDRSWFFRWISGSNQLIYKNYNINLSNDSIQLPLTNEIKQAAITLAFKNFCLLNAFDRLMLSIGAVLLLFMVYKLTYSLTGRLFVSGLFHNYPKMQDYPKMQNYPSILNYSNMQAGQTNDFLDMAGPLQVNLTGLLKKMNWVGSAPLQASDFRRYEEPLANADPIGTEYSVLEVQDHLKKIYEYIWAGLSDEEQIVLYDFAVDGLANYKAGTALYTLVQNGLLYVANDDQLHVMTKSFHNWVLSQSGNEKITLLLKKYRSQGAWQSFRTPLLLVLASVGIFVFFTQEAIYQKITGLFTSISSLVPLLSRFFDKGGK